MWKCSTQMLNYWSITEIIVASFFKGDVILDRFIAYSGDMLVINVIDMNIKKFRLFYLFGQIKKDTF